MKFLLMKEYMHLCESMYVCDVYAVVFSFVRIVIRQKIILSLELEFQLLVGNLDYYLVTGIQTSVYSLLEQKHSTMKPLFKTLTNNILIHKKTGAIHVKDG